MSAYRSRRQLIMAITLSGLLVFSLFSCSGAPHLFKRTQASGNGEGYSGKLTKYEYYSDTDPCSLEASSSDRPPNDVIFISEEYSAQLVRKDCLDIEPEFLSDLSIDATGNSLTYNSKTFALSSEDSSRKLQVLCPMGETYRNGVVASNRITAPIDLYASSWYVQEGIDVDLDGAIGGAPIFRVTRRNGFPAWSSLLEVINLRSGIRYAASAVFEADSSEVARFIFSIDSTVLLEVDVNISTGASTVVNLPNASNIEVRTTPRYNGRLVYLYFVSSLSGNVNIAIGPSPDRAGNAVKATAVRLIDNTPELCQ